MLQVGIKIQGKLLTGIPQEQVRKIANRILTNVALWGEGDVKSQLWKPMNFPLSRHGVDQGYLKRAITGHLVRDLHAQVDPQNIAYAVKVEKGFGTFRGYHMFANTAKKMRKQNFSRMARKVIDKVLG